MRRDLVLIEDMITAADDLAEIIRGKEMADVMSDRTSHHAALHTPAILGEAASRISDGLRSAHPEIPWSKVKGLRNRIVHEYFGIDWQLLWRTATVSVPALREQLVAIRNSLTQTRE